MGKYNTPLRIVLLLPSKYFDIQFCPQLRCEKILMKPQ